MKARALLLFTLTAVPAGAMPVIQSHTSDNGLQVLVVEDHSVPLLTVEIAAKNGAMTESPAYNGLSHLYEHMFFKANGAVPNQEAFLAKGRALGIVWNGTTDNERVNYFFTTTSDHFADAMLFMRDAIVSPLFDEKEFERERVVVTGEIDRNEANPAYHLWHTTEQRVWWKYPSRKDALGNRQTVLHATRKQMQEIQRLYYVPNNSVLVVTGDVRAEDVFQHADRIYADWKRGPDPFLKHPLVEHPPIKKTEVVMVPQPVHTVTGSMTWHGPSTVGKGVDLTYAADLLGVATSEPASRFQKALVDSGACIRASINWYTQKNVGPVTLDFEARPDRVDDCVRAVLAELPRMKREGYLSDGELADAVHRYEVRDALDRERPSRLAHVLTFWWACAGLDYYRGYVENLRRVTQADLGRFLDTYVLEKPYVLGLMLSPDVMKEKGLDQAHFESVLGGGKR